ncbi:MAG: YfhO family protein [Actinomycetota bacterium]|nr:YfhO family protein [Actinomycetota bacterium]
MDSAFGRRKQAARTAGRPGTHLLTLLLYGALATIFTYPLVLNLDRVNGSGDPAVMVWSMAWISHALTTDPATLYGANILHPTPDALAHTDLLLTSALFAAPFFLLTGNALLGFNVVMLLTYVLSGYATFLLVRRLLSGRPYAAHAALFAGALYAFCPYRLAHVAQLNTMTTYWLPLILLFVHRYLEDGRPRDLALVALFFSLNALSGLYYGAFAALMAVLFFVFWSLIHREAPKARELIYGVPVFGAAAALLAALLWPYLARSGGADRAWDIANVAYYSFEPAALLTSPPQSLLLGWTGEAFGITAENGKPAYELMLYPGLAASLLASYALLRRSASRTEALYAALGAAFFVLAWGPLAHWGDTAVSLPYRLLYEHVPGFGSLRVPARMWAIVMLCVAVLAAMGLRALLEALGGRRALATLAAVSLVAALEFAPALPLDRYADRGPPSPEPVYAYLAKNAGDDVVVEVPFASPADPFRETPRMFRSTWGFWRLVNGFASYMPEGYWERRNVLNSFPDPESLAEMRRLGVDYVVAHPREYVEDGVDGAEVMRRAEREPSLERIAGGDGEAVLYRIPGP